MNLPKISGPSKSILKHDNEPECTYNPHHKRASFKEDTIPGFFKISGTTGDNRVLWEVKDERHRQFEEKRKQLSSTTGVLDLKAILSKKMEELEDEDIELPIVTADTSPQLDEERNVANCTATSSNADSTASSRTVQQFEPHRRNTLCRSPPPELLRHLSLGESDDDANHEISTTGTGRVVKTKRTSIHLTGEIANSSLPREDVGDKLSVRFEEMDITREGE